MTAACLASVRFRTSPTRLPHRNETGRVCSTGMHDQYAIHQVFRMLPGGQALGFSVSLILSHPRTTGDARTGWFESRHFVRHPKGSSQQRLTYQPRCRLWEGCRVLPLQPQLGRSAGVSGAQRSAVDHACWSRSDLDWLDCRVGGRTTASSAGPGGEHEPFDPACFGRARQRRRD